MDLDGEMILSVQPKGRRLMQRIFCNVSLLALAVSLAACSSEPPNDLSSGSSADTETSAGSTAGADGSGGSSAAPQTVLDERKTDYGSALRTASLKLVRGLPTLDQIKKLETATDKKAAYEEAIDGLFADARFQERMIKWWKDVMRQGETGMGNGPSRDTAPTFAARVVAEGRPFTDLFTATSNTCPTYDSGAHAFADANCDNGVPATAGVLTNPGVMRQFYGNMAFRRVRWVQEVFVCTKFPAEYSEKPLKKGSADYVSPWPFESIATAPIDFQDTSSVICANCHTTINHIAPLFANFDKQGMWKDGIQVETPVAPEAVTTTLSHWLKDGETTSWRLGSKASNLVELGQAIAADPDVAECAVARAWNFVMSKEDIVSDLATVPVEVLASYQKDFVKNGLNLKRTLRAMFVSDDFTKF